MAKNKLLLILGLAGIGGLAYYEWKKKKGIAPAGTTPTGGNYITPSTGLTTLPATNPSTSPTDTGISADVTSVVQKWGKADGRAPVLQMLAAMIPAEYAGMYDIITNYWDKGRTGPAQVSFWDTIRTKYDPSHITW